MHEVCVRPSVRLSISLSVRHISKWANNKCIHTIVRPSVRMLTLMVRLLYDWQTDGLDGTNSQCVSTLPLRAKFRINTHRESNNFKLRLWLNDAGAKKIHMLVGYIYLLEALQKESGTNFYLSKRICQAVFLNVHPTKWVCECMCVCFEWTKCWWVQRYQLYGYSLFVVYIEDAADAWMVDRMKTWLTFGISGKVDMTEYT